MLSLKMCQNDLSLNMEVVTQMLTRSKYTVDGLLCCCSDAALRTKSVVFGNKLYEKKSHCFEWWLLLLHNFALVCNPMTPYVQKKYDSMIGTTTMRYAICVLAFFSVWNFSSSVCTIELGAVFSFEVQDFWRVSKSRFTKSSLWFKLKMILHKSSGTCRQ